MEDSTERQILAQNGLQRKQEENLEIRYRILTNPEQRKILKERVIELAKQAKDVGMILFMDKSARPIAHLFKRVFPIFNPDTQPPDIKFLNIGIEKFSPIVKWGEGQKIKPPIVIEQVLTQDSITQIYGKKNIEYLEKLLKGNGSKIKSEQKRIIVDDLLHSGRSLRIALKMASLLGKEHNYKGFSFLETDQEKEPFIGKGGLPFMPWKGITGVEDPVQEERDPFSQFGHEDKRSFVSAGIKNQELLQKNTVLRRDLDLLAKEIKSEH